MLKEMKNVTLFQFFKSFFHLTDSFNRYRRTYKNYVHVISKIRKNDFPITATLTNGKKIILKNLSFIIYS